MSKSSDQRWWYVSVAAKRRRTILAVREVIEDQMDVILAKKALKEKGSLPWAKAKKELGLKR